VCVAHQHITLGYSCCNTCAHDASGERLGGRHLLRHSCPRGDLNEKLQALCNRVRNGQFGREREQRQDVARQDVEACCGAYQASSPPGYNVYMSSLRLSARRVVQISEVRVVHLFPTPKRKMCPLHVAGPGRLPPLTGLPNVQRVNNMAATHRVELRSEKSPIRLVGFARKWSWPNRVPVLE
jgi:hypothetical protein